LGFSKKLGSNHKQIKDFFEENKRTVHLFPFSSLNKSMAKLVRTDYDSGKGFRLYAKGASEIMLSRCSHYVDTKGKLQTLDDHLKHELDQTVINRLASEGLRTIGLTYRDFTESEYRHYNWEQDPPNPPQEKYVLIGITGIKDPLRDEVIGAVRECQQAGIMVRMVTGDNIVTAKHIAKQAGILTEGGQAIEGPEFRKLSPEAMDTLIPNLQVMARSSPTDKFTLVRRLKSHGQVVAVTGDGTNDAPALKEAHVGFSMGIAGTEVAKEASDIILMDDNFSSIVKAVMWGRNVYDSIRKFLQFQLTVNLVAVSLAFIGAVTNEHGESPLKPVQLLWVNLIMDTMAALALATDYPSPDLLKRKPYGKNSELITHSMWHNIIGQAAFQLFVNLTILYFGASIFGVPKDSVLHRTLIFNIFVFCQIFNELNSRKLGTEMNIFTGFFTNHICVGVLVFTVFVQILIIQFGGEFASTVPLSCGQWFACIAIGALGLPMSMLIKLVPVPPEAITPLDIPADDEPVKTPVAVPAAVSGWSKIREKATEIEAAKTLESFAKTPGLMDRLRRNRRTEHGGSLKNK